MKKLTYIFIFLSNILFITNAFAGVTSIENNISEPIVDNSCINKTFTMSTSAIITDINIDLNLTHTWRNDLNLTLTSPLGTTVLLSNKNGGSADNLFVYFDDAAATSITIDSVTHTLRVNRSPEMPLGTFNGQDALGVWTLQICDNATFDTGLYNHARIDINNTIVPLNNGLQVNYRMDECYWLGNAGGVLNDVKDSGPLALDATSYASAQTNTLLTTPPLCNAALLNGTTDYLDTPNNPLLATNNTYTISGWVKPSTFANTFSVIMMKTSDYVNGFTFYIYWDGVNTSQSQVILLTGDGTTRSSASAPISANVWSHISATYDGNTIRVYVNGVELGTTAFTTTVANAAQPLTLGVGLGGNYYYNGQMDEFKLFNRTLSATDINTTYNNEFAGNDYNGTARTCPTCSSAPMVPASWELIGIPADLRTAVTKDVATIFDEFNATTYDTIGSPTDWIVYQLDYNTSVSNGTYSFVPYTGIPLQFGKGYWIWSAAAIAWSENGLPSVDYNSTSTGCTANACIELDLVTPGLSGVTLNNMLSFIGNTPVDWADCRITITDISGTTVYTPSAAQTAGFIEKQVWQYNPGAIGVNSNGYTTCDDTTPGGCKLEPYKGFWIRLKDTTINKTVKLLLPKE